MISTLPRSSNLAAASFKLRHASPRTSIIGLQCLYSSSRTFSSSNARFNLPPPYNSKPTSSASSAATTSASETSISSPVNAPATTRPAFLDVPSKDNPQTSGTFSYYFALGKAYLRFYKTGLKNVYGNYKASIPLRKQLGLPAYIPRSPWTDTPASSSGGSTDASSLTRSDFQLVRRSAYDLRRMIPFGFILLICGEFTPLVVLAIGNMVTPMTCRMPKHLIKERGKRIEYKIAALQGLSESQREVVAPSSLRGAKDVHALSAEEVLQSCVVFGLSKRHSLSVPEFLQNMLVNGLYRPRLQRWMEYLAADDKLIKSAGGLDNMVAEEVRLAVDERGGVDVGMGLKEGVREATERKWLAKWLG
ncbi:Letm1 RBD domain-containing protein [Trichophyton interdigitale]|uniref:Letm1 RBD domain-containing protein n=1 Tax=Trichophyton interdigitale TaxID=101480 RepID=A0A9P4YFI3_9EURO|nr:Letm1 RBD domain-containing protein [Trichophyton interdigitale]KAF3895234.1 Letm1 RBD domain-containing protein [Trichophyton interdigitale]KAG8208708.1 Letm1 RBD domain-containing protein [Trichophyton interdigitale]